MSGFGFEGCRVSGTLWFFVCALGGWGRASGPSRWFCCVFFFGGDCRVSGIVGLFCLILRCGLGGILGLSYMFFCFCAFWGVGLLES